MLRLEFKLLALRRLKMRAELAKRHLEAMLERFAVNSLFSSEVMDGVALAHIVTPLAKVLLSEWLGGSLP